MSDRTDPATDPLLKEIGDLARALQISGPSKGPGEIEGAGAVFLIGAGCSVSAGIKHAADVAKFCATELARKLSGGHLTTDDHDAALTWLLDEKKITLTAARAPRRDGSHWGELYTYFFETHFQSANMQREIINVIVEQGGDKLNWAHACLGELVRLGFVHTVLTTNFDQLVLQGIIRTGVMPVIADGLEALNRIVGRPKRPQVVHLHGSMNTYDLRNSAVSMAETSRHNVAQSMVHTLMQECDLLVVVGYSGGEEGIMTLLKDAGGVRRKLVVYWVMYTQSLDDLSENARKLLDGENKFVVWGGSADRFFGQLMSEMRLGQPEWVRDPISVLEKQSLLLTAPQGEALTEIQILIEAFKARVKHAGKAEQRLNEQDELKVRAAAARASGEYQVAYDILERADREHDTDAARLHALNALSLCETKRDQPLLDLAKAELELLLNRTEGEPRLDNALSLGQALLLQSEYAAQDDSGSEAARAPLQKIEEVVENLLPLFPAPAYQLGNARLNLLKAQALQSQGEREPIDVASLVAGRTAYENAITGLHAAKEPGGLLIEAKAGLAALVQVLGEQSKNLALLYDAVERHREVVELSFRTERPLENAGPLSNLAGSLVALATAQEGGDRERSFEEAREIFGRLIAMYQQDGDNIAADDARKSVAHISGALAQSKS